MNEALDSFVNERRLGTLVIAEYFDCKSVPKSSKLIEEYMDHSCHMLELEILKKVTHPFNPFGLSSVYILSESHFSVHTWPEHNYVAVDLFSCKEIQEKEAIKYLSEQFGCTNYHSCIIPRGIGQ